MPWQSLTNVQSTASIGVDRRRQRAHCGGMQRFVEQGSPEWLARRMFADGRRRFVSCYANSKAQIGTGDQRQVAIPAGNGHVMLSPGLVALDADTDTGRWFFDELIESLPDTLMQQTRRGPQAVFRLPDGIALRSNPELFSGLELLTVKIMAPGSTVAGHFYEVIALRPIATLPEMTAKLFANIPGAIGPDPTIAAPEAEPKSSTLTVENFDQWSPDKRRARARAERGAGRSRVFTGDIPDDLKQLVDVLAQTTVPGQRSQAGYSIALIMFRYGRTDDDVLQVIRNNPIRALERHKGASFERFFHNNICKPAHAEIARTSGPLTPRENHPRQWRADYGKPHQAHHWGAVTSEMFLSDAALTPMTRQRLVELVIVHAGWIACYGINHDVSWRVELVAMDITSHNRLNGLHKLLVKAGVLRIIPSPFASTIHATKWEPLIDGVPLTDITIACADAEVPCPQFRLHDDEEILRLLAEAEAMGDRESKVKLVKAWRDYENR
jgi:hypothetical protein